MIAIGSVRIVVFGERGDFSAGLAHQVGESFQDLSVILLLRAFAAGAVALTGTEAIATGVPAFQPPEAKNAAATLAAMAALLGVLFIGLTFLAVNFGITHIDLPEKQTVISQIAGRVYGSGSIPFFLFQGFTALLLVLAANTSFNAFPRLLAILAIDEHMPRQFSFRGDRLAFSYGIIVLATIAASLIVVFGGETHLIIPLYAVGVFIDFTISQAGMIRHWRRERPDGWRRRLAINAFGCTLTAIVAVVVTVAKAPQSLIVIVLIPLLVALMNFVHREYAAQEAELAVRPDFGGDPGRHLRTDARDRRPGRVHHRGSGAGRRPAATLAATGAGSSARHRRVAVPGPGRPAHRLPGRPGSRLAARQAGADHDRRPAGIRGAALVGPSAV